MFIKKKFTIRLHPDRGKEKGFILYEGSKLYIYYI